MNNYQMIHETALRDVVDILNSVKDFDQVKWIQSKNKVGSIAKRASDLILVFPVLVSTSLNIQTATIISKAIERKCAALLQILFASVNLTTAETLQDYISQFHSNLNNHLSLDDFISIIDKFSESGDVEIINKDAYDAVKEAMNNINYYLNTNFNPVSLNEFVSKTDIYGNSNIIKEANDDEFYFVTGKEMKDIARAAANKAANNTAKSITNDRINDIVNGNLKDRVDYFKNQLLPQDVQKANEIMPTLMTVNFTTKDAAPGVIHSTTGVIGVKAKMYPINSMDIVSRLAAKYTDKNSLFKFIKASTSEISFFRDFVFAIDKAKLDAINVAKESNSSKIFKLLERRAIKNKFSALMKKNDASAITSLVISQDEVEYLKKYNSIDMEKSYVTKAIMEAYNLMNITIADETLEVAKFLYDDGDGIYEALSFDGLEKEAKDSSYKKVVNLMSKLNR